MGFYYSIALQVLAIVKQQESSHPDYSIAIPLEDRWHCLPPFPDRYEPIIINYNDILVTSSSVKSGHTLMVLSVQE